MTLEIAAGNHDAVQALFQRSLLQNADAELWICYLQYIKTINSDAQGHIRPDGRTTVDAVFQFALEQMGKDLQMGVVWFDYIQFLRQSPAATAYEEGLRMDSVRNTYHAALAIPLLNIEQIWRDYDQYENSLNRMTARKLINERSQVYMSNRQASKELKIIHDALPKETLAIPMASRMGKAMMTSFRQVWQRKLTWEKEHYGTLEDPARGKNFKLKDRVTLAFKQALAHLRYCPDIWYLFSS